MLEHSKHLTMPRTTGKCGELAHLHQEAFAPAILRIEDGLAEAVRPLEIGLHYIVSTDQGGSCRAPVTLVITKISPRARRRQRDSEYQAQCENLRQAIPESGRYIIARKRTIAVKGSTV